MNYYIQLMLQEKNIEIFNVKKKQTVKVLLLFVVLSKIKLKNIPIYSIINYVNYRIGDKNIDKNN